MSFKLKENHSITTTIEKANGQYSLISWQNIPVMEEDAFIETQNYINAFRKTKESTPSDSPTHSNTKVTIRIDTKGKTVKEFTRNSKSALAIAKIFNNKTKSFKRKRNTIEPQRYLDIA